MKSARFFVTPVLFLSTAVLMACEAFHAPKPEAGPAASEQSNFNPTIKEGEAKLQTCMTLQGELGNEYQMILMDMRDGDGKVTRKATSMAPSFEWRGLTKAERMKAKEKLAQLMAAASEVLELDARKGFVVTNKQWVVGVLDAAYAHTKSLENFEKTFGENFEPKAGSAPKSAYARAYDI